GARAGRAQLRFLATLAAWGSRHCQSVDLFARSTLYSDWHHAGRFSLPGGAFDIEPGKGEYRCLDAFAADGKWRRRRIELPRDRATEAGCFVARGRGATASVEPRPDADAEFSARHQVFRRARDSTAGRADERRASRIVADLGGGAGGAAHRLR